MRSGLVRTRQNWAIYLPLLVLPRVSKEYSEVNGFSYGSKATLCSLKLFLPGYCPTSAYYFVELRVSSHDIPR